MLCFSLPRAELIVGNTVEPSAEFSHTAEAAHIDISLEEGFLSKVVAKRLVAQGEVEEKPPHLGLIRLDQSAKCTSVITERASGNQFEFIYFTQHCAHHFNH